MFYLRFMKILNNYVTQSVTLFQNSCLNQLKQKLGCVIGRIKDSYEPTDQYKMFRPSPPLDIFLHQPLPLSASNSSPSPPSLPPSLPSSNAIHIVRHVTITHHHPLSKVFPPPPPRANNMTMNPSHENNRGA